jgi:glycosyltransferase involved in cell wall biosynthesis
MWSDTIPYREQVNCDLPALTIVVPAYNERNRLPETLGRLASFLDHSSHGPQAEVLVVDDGSFDGTAGLVEEWRGTDSRFRLLSNPGNRGKGYAVRHGMLKASGDWRLMTDADLSTPIEELDRLWKAACEQNVAVVIGSRAINRKLVAKHQSWFRETGGRFFNWVMRAITGLPFADTQCGFKLYRADAAEAVFSRQVLDGFSFDVEDLYLAQRMGFKILELPVAWANVEGTKVTAAATVKAFMDLVRIRWFDWKGIYDFSAGCHSEDGGKTIVP